ncbi:hypothetical protein GCM10007301_53440 [Azorhizobium oxalatiphilum]|uniref:Uncharacterized protein n=1 Tax=Azorhizobium oxalatiphilum TaxID=980631 RepID=A0A917CEU5_9HYPH|nr:hypothetical protein GCM10007301_53440 [Azorhizobium oxalatiphilum]
MPRPLAGCAFSVQRHIAHPIRIIQRRGSGIRLAAGLSRRVIVREWRQIGPRHGHVVRILSRRWRGNGRLRRAAGIRLARNGERPEMHGRPMDGHQMDRYGADSPSANAGTPDKGLIRATRARNRAEKLHHEALL